MNVPQKQGFASVGFPSYRAAMSLGERTRPGLGIIELCLPSPAKAPPSGPGWLHEIKHDGFRIMARRDSAGVRLTTRNGNDFTSRFPSNSRHSADTSLSVHPRPCVSYLSGQMTC